jgi:hypothetical protein
MPAGSLADPAVAAWNIALRILQPSLARGSAGPLPF